MCYLWSCYGLVLAMLRNALFRPERDREREIESETERERERVCLERERVRESV